MGNIKCKTCGGSVNRVGNYYVCEWCRNKWEIDSGNDIHAVERANAWAALRDGDFEKAAELFENIIVKDGNNHEAYWGRALAMGGIIYVTDLNENKKVPTCNNITEESIINSKDVQKAITLAPADIAESYQKQAAYIERVRKEWLEKASKEPAYDVFISFKDSDRENGIERTQDSIDAQDLYNALVAEGYKVFFSRISLRDKISEQYEPYIYNAIKTAKVMIVFGEKAEYFSSVWIKNEWTRFKTRIEKGEKHKNSLVVVYKNMNPGDLPVVLKSRQCLNASDMTFLSDLTRHIRRVVEESKRNVHLEKIEIAGGQVAKKASSLAVNSVQTREIGAGAIAETSITEKQSVSLLLTYLEVEQWSGVIDLSEDILFNNPSCAEAIWCRLLAEKQASNANSFVSKLKANDNITFAKISKVFDCASSEFAKQILIQLYDSAPEAGDKACAKLLETILPYNFSERGVKISEGFGRSIEKDMYESFCVLITTLDESAVDKYIDLYLSFAKKTSSIQTRTLCFEKVLEVDGGNAVALMGLVVISLEEHKSASETKTKLEQLLKFSPEPDAEVIKVITWLEENAQTNDHVEFSKELLRYYSADLTAILDKLKALAQRLIQIEAYEVAEYFFQLIISKGETSADVLWNVCLIKTRAKNEEEIKHSNIFLNDIPEFKKLLTIVDKTRQLELVELTKMQEGTVHVAACRDRIDKFNLEHIMCRSDLTPYYITTDGCVRYYENGVEHILSQARNNIAVYRGAHSLDGDTILYINDRGTLTERVTKQRKDFPPRFLIDYHHTLRDSDNLYYYKSPASQEKVKSVVGRGGDDNLFVKMTDGAIKTYNISEHLRDYIKTYYECALYWDDIKKIIVGSYGAGWILKENGSVLYHYDSSFPANNRRSITSKNTTETGCDKILDLVRIHDGDAFCLREDGTVICLDKITGQPKKTKWDLSNWRNIVSIGGCKDTVVGVKSDGTVVAAGDRYNGDILSIDNAIAVCDEVIVKADGHVVYWNGSSQERVENIRLFNNIDTLEEEIETAKKDFANSQKDTNKKSGGCYIATAVYGSYDCPSVWTLRRFRDNVLQTSWYGRFFIRCYYAISPTLVKWFGNTSWFTSLFRPRLNKLVSKLQSKGFKDTPYED